MENIKIANYSENQLNILYEKYKSENNIENLLSVLFKKLKSTKNEKAVIYEIGKTYFQIEMFERAKEYFFKLLDYNDDYYNLRAFNGLGACFYKLNDNVFAGYYFSKQIKINNQEYLIYNDLATEFFDEVYDLSDSYYIAYPYDKADFTNLLNKSSALIGMGKFNEAIELLDVIPKTSKFYQNKLLQLGICSYFLKDYGESIKYIDQAIENGNNDVIPLLNAINVSYDMNDYVSFNRYVDSFSKIDLDKDYENLFKAFLIFCETKKYDKAIELGEKYVKKYPYNYLVRYFLGITYLNLKNFEKAKINFSKCMQLYDNFICKTYFEIACDEKLCKSLLKEENFKYTFDIPPQKKISILKIVMVLSSLENLNKKEKELLKEYFKYALLIELQPFSLKIFEFYFKSNLKLSKEEYGNIFLSSSASDLTKREIIRLLILNDYKANFGCVLNNEYTKIRLPICEFVGDNSDFFKQAFAVACSKIITNDSLVKKLYETAKKIFDTVSFFNLSSLFDDVFSLSATIYELTSGISIKNRRSFAKRFSANLKTIKRYKETYFNCLEKLKND